MYSMTAWSSTLLSWTLIPLSIAYFTRKGPASTVKVHSVTNTVAASMRRRYGRSIANERRMTCAAFVRSSLSSSSTADMKNIAHPLAVVVGAVRVGVGCHGGGQHVAVPRAGREKT